jgi:predicted phage-related endonuclease
VGEEYRRLHPEHTVRRVNAICRSKERPWAQASLDYEVYQPEKGWGILEIKTAGLRVASDWDEGVPLYYQTQIMHYMAVTGRSYAVVAVLIGGSDYREFTIERDEDDIATINGMVDAFWHENVLKGTAPAATGARSDSAALLQANPKETDEFLELPEEEVSISEYYRFKHERDTAQESMDAIQNQLKQAIGDNKGLETGKYKVTWVRGNAKTFDKKAMKAKYPDIYQEFEGESLRDGGLRFTERKPHDGGSKKRS